MRNTSSKTLPLFLARCCLAIYMVYNVYLVPIEFFIPRLSIMMLFLSTLLTVISVKPLKVKKEIQILFGFLIYAITTGVIVAIDTGILFGQALFLFESIWAGAVFFNLVKDVQSFRLFTLAFALGSFMLGAYCVLNPNLLLTVNGRVTLGEDFNANTLGVILMFGSWFVIFTMNGDKTGIVRISITFALLLLLLYVIILSASRKAVFGYAFFVLAWFVQMFIGGSAKTKKIIRIVGMPLLVVLGIYIYQRFSDSFIDASEILFKRMDTVEEGMSDRESIIKESWSVFLDNPIIGVGLDNNRFHTAMKLYAHNSYFELLACTGIIGAFIFFSLYYKMLAYLFRHLKRINQFIQQPLVYYTSTLIVVYLFIGYGQIHMYNQNLMFILYFIFALISFDQQAQDNISR